MLPSKIQSQFTLSKKFLDETMCATDFFSNSDLLMSKIVKHFLRRPIRNLDFGKLVSNAQKYRVSMTQ